MRLDTHTDTFQSFLPTTLRSVVSKMFTAIQGIDNVARHLKSSTKPALKVVSHSTLFPSWTTLFVFQSSDGNLFRGTLTVLVLPPAKHDDLGEKGI